MPRFILLLLPLLIPVLLALFATVRASFNFFLPRTLNRRRTAVNLCALAGTVLVGGLAVLVWRYLLVGLGYALVFAGLIELAARILRRILKKRRPLRRDGERFLHICGNLWKTRLLPFALALLCVGAGALNMQNLHTVRYEITAPAGTLTEEIRIGLLSDFHYGTVQSTDIVKDYLASLSEENLDFLFLAGDMTDEGTSKEQMEELFSQLGTVKTRYGIFAVDGNHDHKNYAQAEDRTYGLPEYREAMEKNGIRFLEDGCWENGFFRVIGRKDASSRNRMPGNAFLTEEQRNDGKYTVLLDHQPNSASETDWEDADLVLCGHTHGGQVFPVGLFLELAGYSSGRYDEEHRTVIVTSGVAGWGFRIKTQGAAEGVVITVRPAS